MSRNLSRVVVSFTEQADIDFVREAALKTGCGLKIELINKWLSSYAKITLTDSSNVPARQTLMRAVAKVGGLL